MRRKIASVTFLNLFITPLSKRNSKNLCKEIVYKLIDKKVIYKGVQNIIIFAKFSGLLKNHEVTQSGVPTRLKYNKFKRHLTYFQYSGIFCLQSSYHKYLSLKIRVERLRGVFLNSNCKVSNGVRSGIMTSLKRARNLVYLCFISMAGT